MFTNLEVLKKARESFDWKLSTAREVTASVPNPFKIKNIGSTFDVRYPEDIASLIVDMSGVPENEREAYYRKQVEQIAKAFFTLDEKTNLPYPEAIEPYIKQVYEKMTTTEDINWDSVEEVERLLATEKASQSFATFVTDFPGVFFKLYPTPDDIRRIDNLTAKSSLICHDARIFLGSNSATVTNSDKRDFIIQSNNSFENELISELGHRVIDARIKGDDDIHLDTSVSDLTKKYFLDKPFEFDNGGALPYNNDSYAKDYLMYLARSYKHTSVEQVSDDVISKAPDYDTSEYDHLYINGKSVRDSIRDLEKQGCKGFAAQVAVGKQLKNALTDGKSIVTMMRVVTAAGGKTEFSHQEIKIDLDKLNQVDKKETNYSRFRRFLDRMHIWKIQRFKSNDARDAAQAKLRSSEKFQKALREAEDKFINRYNSDEVQDKLTRANPALAEVIPKIVRAEEFEKNKQMENDSARVPLGKIDLEANKTVKLEPKHDHQDKTLSNDQKAI